MTLASTVLFPHAMLPLYIFEPRYRQMLEDVLAGDRLFVVAREDENRGLETGEFEPAYPVASVGIVRACQQDKDGCSHLSLQGLYRVRFSRIVRENPYRVAEFEALRTVAADADHLADHRHRLARLVLERQRLGSNAPDEVFDFLDALGDPETYLDLASFTLCDDNDVKQNLLETLDVNERFEKLCHYLRRSNASLALERKLRGNLDSEDVGRN